MINMQRRWHDVFDLLLHFIAYKIIHTSECYLCESLYGNKASIRARLIAVAN